MLTKAIQMLIGLGYDEWDLYSNISGYTEAGGSSYIRLPDIEMTIRVSDHAQGEFGGFSILRGKRHAPADYSISPGEKSVNGLLSFVCQQMAIDNLPEWDPDEVMEYGHS